MAKYRYYADIENEVYELAAVWFLDGNAAKASNFSGLLPSGARVKATRKVEYKPYASKHICDYRCMNASGSSMKCECACGGRNHGRSAFICEPTLF